MRPLGRRRMGLAELQIIIVGKLFPGPNVTPGVDENAVIFIFDLTVGHAGMIDPARRIAAPGSVNDDFISDFEQHGMRRVRLRFGIARVGFFVRDALTGVFDDAGFFWNKSERKYTTAMNS